MFQQLKSWGDVGGLPTGDWPRLQAAIEFHEAFGGEDRTGDMVHPHEFEDVWPIDPGEVPEYFSNRAQYQAWRNILIAGLESFSGQVSRKSEAQEAAKDDWMRLRDRCRELELGSVHENNLMALRRVANRFGTLPQMVDQKWAEGVQKNLDTSDRAVFRAGVGAFEKVRTNADIRRDFGLSDIPIASLDRKPSPNEETPLPPRIKADFEEWIGLLAAGEPVGFRGRRREPVAEVTLRSYRFAFAWYWRCFAMAFPDQPDPDTAALARQDVLDEISRFADETKGLCLKPSMKKEYFGKILPFLQRWNPQLIQPTAAKDRKYER